MLWDWQTLRLARAPKLIACHAVWLEGKKGQTDGRMNGSKESQTAQERQTDGQTNRRQRLKRVSFRPKEHSPPMKDETSVSTRRLLGVSCVRVCASPSPPNHHPPIHAEVEGGFIKAVEGLGVGCHNVFNISNNTKSCYIGTIFSQLHKKLLYGGYIQP